MNVTPPLISVVTATYNRSNTLYYSLLSLQEQTFGDWECIIVGDACTDDTAEVVESFNEERFRFFNLETNYGEQTGPNNFGCAQALGKYIAFLNHDDLYFPDHLSTMLETIERTGADLVYTVPAMVWEDDSIRVRVSLSDGKYMPHIFTPASTWMFRRELLETVGPWRSSRETHNAPSQDWIFRAWKLGHNIRINPQLTIILIQAARRKNCYRTREISITEQTAAAMKNDPDLRYKIILNSLLSDQSNFSPLGFFRNMKTLVRGMVYRLLLKAGIAPLSVINYIKYRSRGGFIPYLRKKRGLEKK